MRKLRTVLIVVVVLAAIGGALYGLGRLFFPDNPLTMITASLHIPRPKPEVIVRFHLGSVEIPITSTAFSSFVAMLILVILAALISRGMSRKSREERIKNPRGWQNLVEWAMEYLINLLEGAAGKERLRKRPLGRLIFPLVGTLFVFIIFANWFSLAPGFSTIVVVPPETHAEAAPVEHGGAVEAAQEEAAHEEAEEHHANPRIWWLFGREKAEHAEPAPILRAPNSHLAITAGMAIVAVVTVQALAIVAHGPIGYLRHLATDAPVWMRFIMFPIHVISEFSRIISLSARLFGNLYGGDVLLAVIFNLIAPLVPAVFFGIEAFFYYIQALLFSVLTTVYIVLAVGGGHGEEHAH